MDEWRVSDMAKVLTLSVRKPQNLPRLGPRFLEPENEWYCRCCRKNLHTSMMYMDDVNGHTCEYASVRTMHDTDEVRRIERNEQPIEHTW